MKQVILISGKAESGKDYTAELIKEELENANQKVLILHFADLLKFLCTKFFAWDGKKNKKGRSLLQETGQRVRSYDKNYWVDEVCKIINIFKNDFDYFIVPDTRFENEINIPKQEFGENVQVIRIIRDNWQNQLTQEQRNEISETALDGKEYLFDKIIHNPGNYEKYIKIIRKEITNPLIKIN